MQIKEAKNILIALLFLCCTETGKANVLTSSVISLVDGKKIGITGHTMLIMMDIRRKMITILSARVHFFENKMWTLTELAQFEQEHKKNKRRIRKLHETCLEAIIQEISARSCSYAKLAHGAKSSLLVLINESCKQHNRSKSILQNWGQVKDGTESEQLYRDLKNMQLCAEFCQDMVNFLEDMMSSCPIGQAQLYDLMLLGNIYKILFDKEKYEYTIGDEKYSLHELKMLPDSENEGHLRQTQNLIIEATDKHQTRTAKLPDKVKKGKGRNAPFFIESITPNDLKTITACYQVCSKLLNNVRNKYEGFLEKALLNKYRIQ